MEGLNRSWLLTFVLISVVVHVYLLVASSLDAVLGFSGKVRFDPPEMSAQAKLDKARQEEEREREKSEKAEEEGKRIRAATGDMGGSQRRILSTEDLEKVGAGADMQRLTGQTGQQLIAEPPDKGPTAVDDMFDVNSDSVGFDVGFGEDE